MQPLHKNENVLFKDFRDFLVREGVSMNVVSLQLCHPLNEFMMSNVSET